MNNEELTIKNEELTIKKEEDSEKVIETKQNTLTVENLDEQISLNIKDELITVTLPDENKKDANEWDHIIEQFQSRLQGMEKEWESETKVHLLVNKRLLDNRQLQTVGNILKDVNLKLDLIVTSRRQTAVTAASAGYSVKQESESQPLVVKEKVSQQNYADPLYLKHTVRSGVEIRHSGTVIVFGDVNPGAIIVAGGDVLVWGGLKGIAHSGAFGNRKSLIMALKMDPTQLRIADLVARSPNNLPEDFDPEVAYISNQGIRISSALNFNKTNFFSKSVKSWTDSQNKGLI